MKGFKNQFREFAVFRISLASNRDGSLSSTAGAKVSRTSRLQIGNVRLIIILVIDDGSPSRKIGNGGVISRALSQAVSVLIDGGHQAVIDCRSSFRFGALGFWFRCTGHSCMKEGLRQFHICIQIMLSQRLVFEFLNRWARNIFVLFIFQLKLSKLFVVVVAK